VGAPKQESLSSETKEEALAKEGLHVEKLLADEGPNPNSKL